MLLRVVQDWIQSLSQTQLLSLVIMLFKIADHSSVELSDSIVFIESEAFCRYNGFESIEIPKNVCVLVKKYFALHLFESYLYSRGPRKSA